MGVRASLFGATLTARPAVPRAYLLAGMSDPKLLALMIPSLGTLNKWRLLWRNLKAYFMIQLPGRTAWGFVFEPSSSTSSTTRTSATPTTPLRVEQAGFSPPPASKRHPTQSKPLKIILDIRYQYAIMPPISRNDSTGSAYHARPPRGPSNALKILSLGPVTFLPTPLRP
jgi:hypothetical protein